jgi:hypothetical protein
MMFHFKHPTLVRSSIVYTCLVRDSIVYTCDTKESTDGNLWLIVEVVMNFELLLTSALFHAIKAYCRKQPLSLMWLVQLEVAMTPTRLHTTRTRREC